ncbi:MAG: lipid-A-disaccharide synthase [Akkermansiaceae bacterium]|nr:lipid-A-disaccharide synthase [Akkermansiaceae bacterium]
MTSRTVYVVAGEVSGDTHGSELMDALGKQAGGFSFRGLGGPEMSRLSEGLVRDWVEDAAVVGVWEVLRRYGWFKKRFEETLSEILELRPAVLLLIDYPGFNLRLAKQIHEKLPATKIVHYVAPQVWAWNQKRIPQIATTHDLMICLFPFEVPLFEEAGLRSRCLGHPLVDELEEKRIKVGRRENLIGLFPGSRIKEVCRLFPMMLESASRLLKENPEIRFVAAAASEKVARVMGNFLEASGLPDNLVEVQTGESQYLMQTVTCGVVASGTATLEAAYYGMPYCLVYRVAWPTFLMAKQLVKLKFIGLINILAGRELVREFIQTEANAYEVALWLGQALANEGERAKLSGELLEAASRLGEPGVHERAAHEIALLFTE